MDNQHRKIAGYRDLTQEEIDLMNEAKKLEQHVGNLYRRMLKQAGGTEDSPGRLDGRCLSLARTNLQQGFMWMVRAVARPEGGL